MKITTHTTNYMFTTCRKFCVKKLTQLNRLHFKEFLFFEQFVLCFGVRKTKFGILRKIEILGVVDFGV